ncbi:MAG: hypothetical protein H0W72_06950 [Planctomycetes bacterium]|nr:hypothetical protein [Planctomycetota bacterium]
MKPITSEDEFEVAASDYREAMTGYRLAKSQAQADVFAARAVEIAHAIDTYCAKNIAHGEAQDRNRN